MYRWAVYIPGRGEKKRTKDGGGMGTMGRNGFDVKVQRREMPVHKTRIDQQDTFVAAAKRFIHPRPSRTRPKETPGISWLKTQWLWAIAS